MSLPLLTVVANGQHLTVDVTSPSGSHQACWSDAGRSSALSLPLAITADQDFYLPVGSNLVTVSVSTAAGVSLLSEVHEVGPTDHVVVTPLPNETQQATTDSSGTVRVAHLRLEPAWIIAHSTDYATQVLVAGDATKTIIPLAGVVSLTYATTAYTGAGATDTDLLVGFGDPTGTPADMLGGPLSVWSATANTVAQLPQFANGGTQLVSQPPGADLRLYLLGSGLADGDSPVDVWVTYVLQTI